MINHFQPKLRSEAARAISLAIFVCGLLTALPQSANAQYFGYSPYTGSSNWLWMARSLMSPLSRYSGYNAPFYLANSLVWNASYGLSQGLGLAPYRRYNAGQYLDPSATYDPVNGGRMRTRPFVSSGQIMDQSVHANWVPPNRPWPQDQQIDPQTGSALTNNQSANQQSQPQWVPVPQQAGADPVPGVTPQQADFDIPAAPAVSAAYPAAPVPAPDRTMAPNAVPTPTPALANAEPQKRTRHAGKRKKHDVPDDSNASSQTAQLGTGPVQTPLAASAPRIASSAPSAFGVGPLAQTAGAAPVSTSSPLTRGFIHLMNDNFGGDVNRALADADMRKYARAIGLIQGNESVPEVNHQRVELIRQILQDEREEPTTRVMAVKMLLKQNQSSAVAGSLQ